MDLRINCPRCKRKNVAAVAYAVKGKGTLLRWTTNWVRCSGCGADLYSKAPAAALSGLQPGQIDAVLSENTPLMLGFLGVLCILFGAIPALGALTGLFTLAVSYKRGGWVRTCSILAIVASLATTGIVVKMTLEEAHRKPHLPVRRVPAQTQL